MSDIDKNWFASKPSKKVLSAREEKIKEKKTKELRKYEDIEQERIRLIKKIEELEEAEIVKDYKSCVEELKVYQSRQKRMLLDIVGDKRDFCFTSPYGVSSLHWYDACNRDKVREVIQSLGGTTADFIDCLISNSVFFWRPIECEDAHLEGLFKIDSICKERVKNKKNKKKM